MSSDASQRLAAALAALDSASGNDAVRLRMAALAKASSGASREAVDLAEQAVARDPNYAAGLVTLAKLLLDSQQTARAAEMLQRATELTPDDAAAWHFLGRAWHARDRLDQAVAAQIRATELDRSYRDAWRWLGFSRQFDGDLEGALHAYQKAQALRYEPNTALRMALLAPAYATSMQQIDWARERIPRELARLADSGLQVAEPHRAIDAATGMYAYWGGEDKPLHEAFAAFWRRVSPSLCWTAPHVADWQPPHNRRPRIAYVTHHTYRHTVNRMFGGVARNLGRFGFDVRVFSTNAVASPERDEIEAACGKIVVLREDLAEARQAIADFQPDAVIYPDIGLHLFMYFLAFARLAPLQITTWGHAATSGVASIDVFLGSSDLDSPDAERFYSEELVRLDPPPVSYRPHLADTGGVGRAQLGLPDNARLYVCSQALSKLRPDFDAVLAKILARDPQGLVVIVGSARDQSVVILHRRLAAAIPDWQRRVRLIERLPDNHFIALLRTADAILDSHYFAGGSTSYDLVSLGCPFVTLPGEASKGRVGLMLYRVAGLDELIARDVDHYVELALRLAQDRPWHRTLAARLAAAAPGLLEHERGYQGLADWLHGRLARPLR